ncbi:MAG: thermonuclease family protein [Burkholderiaceae bacterium]
MLATLLAWMLGAAAAQPITGRVVEVIDGDTVTVLVQGRKQLKVRLAGIDAPERKQAFGQRAKQRLSALVFRKTVTVVGHKQDRYRRLIAKLLVDGHDTNLEMIALGYAWHFKRYERDQSPEDRVAYSQAEARARAERSGLWEEPDPLPPWEFRHAQ